MKLLATLLVLFLLSGLYFGADLKTAQAQTKEYFGEDAPGDHNSNRSISSDLAVPVKSRIRQLYQISKRRDEYTPQDLKQLIEEIDKLANRHDLDMADKWRIARLYAINKNDEKAVQAFKSAIESIVGTKDYTSYNPKSFLALLNSYLTCSCYSQDKDVSAYFSYAKTIPDVMLDDDDRYQLAVIAEKIGDSKDEKAILTKLIEAPYTLKEIKGKAIFRLGKILAWEKDYSAAADVYKVYIDTLPEFEKFALKAYQKYVDYKLLAENRELDEESAQKMVDIMNGLDDSATAKMETAAYIKEKGYESISDPLFDWAYKDLLKSAQNENNITYKRSKLMSLIRATHKYVDYEKTVELSKQLISASGECKDLRYKAVIAPDNEVEIQKNAAQREFKVNTNEDSYRHTWQALLWAATAYRELQEFQESIRYYDAYLMCMPNHNDNDFAAYRISLMYKALGDVERAKQYENRIANLEYREAIENDR